MEKFKEFEDEVYKDHRGWVWLSYVFGLIVFFYGVIYGGYTAPCDVIVLAMCCLLSSFALPAAALRSWSREHALHRIVGNMHTNMRVESRHQSEHIRSLQERVDVLEQAVDKLSTKINATDSKLSSYLADINMRLVYLVDELDNLKRKKKKKGRK